MSAGERWMGPAVISQSYPRSPRIHLIQDISLRRIPGKPFFVSLFAFITRKMFLPQYPLKNVFYNWLILCIVFNIPLQNISFIWRRILHQQWTAQCRPQLNVHDLETEGVFIVHQLLDTGPRFLLSHRKDAPFLLRKRGLPRTYFNSGPNGLIL